jgi:ABC-type Zn2+ transport system substrate-binding protein/surface adhesin
VAGPVADVILILPPGASPQTFEPTPSAVRGLSGARTLFVIGHGLDDWAARLARGAGVPRLVRVDAGLALRREGGHEGGPVDPHYWLSIRNGEVIARTVAAELERLVIPAATAKLLAPSLRRMFVLAPVVGLASVLAGLVASYRLDLPSGPAIVVVAGLALLIAWVSAAARRAGAR